MNILITDKLIKINTFKPFTPDFDQVMISYDENIQNNFEIKPTKSNLNAFFNEALNFSWDGEIYWFGNDHKEKVLALIKEWFNNPQNHTESEEGISSCILLKNTPNGIAIINTQYDTIGSKFDEFGSFLSQSHPEIDYLYYSDSHLIDNLYLGRESCNNEFDLLFKFYQENIIDSSFFFQGLEMDEEDEEHNYSALLPKDKNIVITGKFPFSREEITDILSEKNFNVSDTINSDSWLWMGEKVGQNKMNKAAEKGAECSTIFDIITLAYNNYKKRQTT